MGCKIEWDENCVRPGEKSVTKEELRRKNWNPDTHVDVEGVWRKHLRYLIGNLHLTTHEVESDSSVVSKGKGSCESKESSKSEESNKSRESSSKSNENTTESDNELTTQPSEFFSMFCVSWILHLQVHFFAVDVAITVE